MSMAGSQMDPRGWKDEVKRVSRLWRSMSDPEKEPYHAMACEEQAYREDAACQPFQSHEGPNSQPPAFDAASHVSRSGLKKVSKHRALQTYQRVQSADAWGHFDAGLSCCDGAMGPDHIDLQITGEDMCSAWSRFVKPAGEQDFVEYDADAENVLHHVVCGSGHGLCKTCPCYDLVCMFAGCLHEMMKDRAWTRSDHITDR